MPELAIVEVFEGLPDPRSGATLEIARSGLTHNTHHTSNAKEYLKGMVPDYRDENFYVDELAVTEKNVITASGLGSVEFGREVIRQLSIYNKADLQQSISVSI